MKTQIYINPRMWELTREDRYHYQMRSCGRHSWGGMTDWIDRILYDSPSDRFTGRMKRDQYRRNYDKRLVRHKLKAQAKVRAKRKEKAA